jgi:hypothetical protein
LAEFYSLFTFFALIKKKIIVIRCIPKEILIRKIRSDRFFEKIAQHPKRVALNQKTRIETLFTKITS